MPSTAKRNTGPSSSSQPASRRRVSSSKKKASAKKRTSAKKAPAKKAPAKKAPANKIPDFPEDAAPINLENLLNRRFMEEDLRWDRPAFLFDVVDPVAKFRHMGNAYRSHRKDTDVSEGEESGDLTDNPGADTRPVSVYAYRRKYVVEIVGGPGEATALFDYDDKRLCKVSISKVVLSPNLKGKEREFIVPTKKDIQHQKTVEIHRGYLRFLAGMIREIAFSTEDGITNHNCLFRAEYSVMILDRFAEELMRKQRAPGVRWRSRVLNPLLQRQLEGITDYEAKSVVEAVGPTVEAAARFYLTRDPLDPSNTLEMMHNILYIWPVRQSLACLYTKASESNFHHSMKNAQSLIKAFIDDASDWRMDRLSWAEQDVIENEELEDHFGKLIELTKDLSQNDEGSEDNE